jgi:hypothetical protein
VAKIDAGKVWQFFFREIGFERDKLELIVKTI